MEATYGPALDHLGQALPANNSLAACDVPYISSDSALWSHSAGCPNFPYVQMQAQTLSTAWGTLQGVAVLFFLPVFGKIADVYGRRQVFYWTTVMTILSFFIFTVDAALGLGDWSIYMTAPLLATFATHGAVGWAMAVDLVPDPAEQAMFSPLMTPILNGAVASVIGDVLAYFLLAMHIVDYTWVWLVLTVLAVCACIFIWSIVPETMANPKAFPGFRELFGDVLPCVPQPAVAKNKGVVAAEQGYGFALFCRGPDGLDAEATVGAAARRRVMHVVLALTCIGAVAGGVNRLNNNYMMGPMHFKQEEVIYVSFARKAYVVVGTALSAILIPRAGPFKCATLL